MSKKGTLKIRKSKIATLVQNQCAISAVFQIVRLPGDQKTELTGDSLYFYFVLVNALHKRMTSNMEILSFANVRGFMIFFLILSEIY